MEAVATPNIGTYILKYVASHTKACSSSKTMILI